MTGRTGQFSVGTEVRLGGGSARAVRLENDLLRLWDLVGRQMPCRRLRRDEGQRIGDGDVGPEVEDLPNMPWIIGIAIEMLGRQLELGIQGGTSNAHPEDDEEGDRKDTLHRPTHAGIVARGMAVRSSRSHARRPGMVGDGGPG